MPAHRGGEQSRYDSQQRIEAAKEDARHRAQEELDRQQWEDIEKRRREIVRRDKEQAWYASEPDARPKELGGRHAPARGDDLLWPSCPERPRTRGEKLQLAG